MKFMVITRIRTHSIPFLQRRGKKSRTHGDQYTERMRKEGKLKGAYTLGNMKGTMLILDLDSPEDLVRLAENPVFPFVDVEITPLVEMDVVRKAQAKK